MYRFIETIRVEDHQLQHLEGHNKRLNETRKHFFSSTCELDLNHLLVLPDNLDDGVYKCRIVYDDEIVEVTFQPYIPKNIQTLKLVIDDTAEYSFKFENRSMLQLLLSQKGEADDILIVRNGCITDTSFSNIAFFDGMHWYTPDTYLLNGTCRQRLLAEHILRETRITLHNLANFEEIRPINAMLVLERTPSVRLMF
ncbi:MAG TPA: aminotransferase class IV family protein [Bacteroidales bacterium]|nr:aminotransferase class IV family protein [Bacteroidales bacterium]